MAAALPVCRRRTMSKSVAFHEKVWGIKLVCPAGGQYVWNDADQTMESTAFGHPGAFKDIAQTPDPLAGVELLAGGLTFEEDGLRARVTIKTDK